MCDAVCHARKYVVPSETEILLEPNISCMVNTAFIQDVVIPSTTTGTCSAMDVHCAPDVVAFSTVIRLQTIAP